jgi:hypothetical protein
LLQSETRRLKQKALLIFRLAAKREINEAKQSEKIYPVLFTFILSKKIRSEKKAKEYFIFSFPEAKRMRNGSRFASFLIEAKTIEAKPAHPISECACVNLLAVSTRRVRLSVQYSRLGYDFYII